MRFERSPKRAPGISAFTAGAAACSSGFSLEPSVPFCAEKESDQLVHAILNYVQDKSVWAYRPVLGSLISCFPKPLLVRRRNYVS